MGRLVWDAIHTVIRPVGGALIAVATLGDASPTVEGLVGASRRHAGRRLSLHEDGNARGGQHESGAVLQLDPQHFRGLFVVGLGFVALKYPTVAAVIVIVAVILMIVFATWIRQSGETASAGRGTHTLAAALALYPPS